MDRQRKADMMLVLATGFWGISNCLIAISCAICSR